MRRVAEFPALSVATTDSRATTRRWRRSARRAALSSRPFSLTVSVTPPPATATRRRLLINGSESPATSRKPEAAIVPRSLELAAMRILPPRPSRCTVAPPASTRGLTVSSPELQSPGGGAVAYGSPTRSRRRSRRACRRPPGRSRRRSSRRRGGRPVSAGCRRRPRPRADPGPVRPGECRPPSRRRPCRCRPRRRPDRFRRVRALSLPSSPVTSSPPGRSSAGRRRARRERDRDGQRDRRRVLALAEISRTRLTPAAGQNTWMIQSSRRRDLAGCSRRDRCRRRRSGRATRSVPPLGAHGEGVERGGVLARRSSARRRPAHERVRPAAAGRASGSASAAATGSTRLTARTPPSSCGRRRSSP